MTDVNWVGVMLPLGGAAVACLALLLPARWRIEGPPELPAGESGRACTLLLLFTALVLASSQVDPLGEWAPLRIALDYGGSAGFLVLACSPAFRRRHKGWGRAGLGRLPLAAAVWLVVLLAGVAVFRIVLLSYVPCRCPALDPEILGWGRVAASAGFAGVLVPLVEEVLFRWIALPLFVVRMGPRPAVLLAAVAWAMAHGERPLLPLIVLGVAFGKLTLATGSIWASVGFHAAWNGAVVGHEIYRRAAAAPGPVPAPVIFLAVVGFVLGWAQLLDAGRPGRIQITGGGARTGDGERPRSEEELP
jgi:membrane protease YdiL (CAAX protease family)